MSSHDVYIDPSSSNPDFVLNWFIYSSGYGRKLFSFELLENIYTIEKLDIRNY